MASWHDFADAAPELAEIGTRMLQLGREHGGMEGGLGYLATVSAAGRPRVLHKGRPGRTMRYTTWQAPA